MAGAAAGQVRVAPGKWLVFARGRDDTDERQARRAAAQHLPSSSVQKIMRFPNQKASAEAQHLAPAVVVGGSLNALGVVRSLSAGGMTIYLLDTTRACAAGWSRYCRFVPIPALDGKALIDALIGLAAQLTCRPVLILTSDQCVDTVSAHRQELESLYHFSLPTDQMVRALADKTLFQSLAERAGFEVPRGVCVANMADLERIADLQPPLIIKPGDKTLVLRGLADRILRAETVSEAKLACAKMLLRVPAIVVQEWIDGPDSDLLFTLFACDSDGKLLGMFHGRKLVCDPPAVGTTAVCCAAPEMAAELMAQTENFIARVGYCGLGSLEFKQDRQRNCLAIIEPTVGRTDWQSEIATLCGVNLPLSLYRAELGLAPAKPQPAAPVAWRSSAGYRADIGADTRTVDGFFRWADPLPACYYYLHERGLMRIWRRLVRVGADPVYASQHEGTSVDVETTIVGAGPYGLSIAAHLRARRTSFEQFGTPLESWRAYMPEGMILKSEPFASNLWDPQRRFTLQRYCESHAIPYQRLASPVKLSHFLNYAQWFREQAVGTVREMRVANIARNDRGFRLRLADGTEFTSRRVVLATGHMAFGIVPTELGGLPDPLVVHSSRMAVLNQYAGRDVCIIGAGQSALETAALLHEAGARVRVLVRRPEVVWNPIARARRSLWQRVRSPDAGVGAGWPSVAISELPRLYRWRYPADKRHRFLLDSYGPTGAWWLRERVQGHLNILFNTKIEAAAPDGDGLRLIVRGSQGRTELHTDHVIAGTGYRVDIDRLDYLDESLKKDIVREAQGIPALNSQFESSVPGLLIVGIAAAPVFGPIMRFMYGAKHVAPIVTRRLA